VVGHCFCWVCWLVCLSVVFVCTISPLRFLLPPPFALSVCLPCPTLLLLPIHLRSLHLRSLLLHFSFAYFQRFASYDFNYSLEETRESEREGVIVGEEVGVARRKRRRKRRSMRGKKYIHMYICMKCEQPAGEIIIFEPLKQGEKRENIIKKN